MGPASEGFHRKFLEIPNNTGRYLNPVMSRGSKELYVHIFRVSNNKVGESELGAPQLTNSLPSTSLDVDSAVFYPAPTTVQSRFRDSLPRLFMASALRCTLHL
jgi:hypothetical protein